MKDFAHPDEFGRDKPANLAQASALIEQAVAEDRPDWVLLPECFDFMGGSRDTKRGAAERLPDTSSAPCGPAYGAVRDLARQHGVYIHAGSLLEQIPDDDRIGNTTVVFDRGGVEVARYRKMPCTASIDCSRSFSTLRSETRSNLAQTGCGSSWSTRHAPSLGAPRTGTGPGPSCSGTAAEERG